MQIYGIKGKMCTFAYQKHRIMNKKIYKYLLSSLCVAVMALAFSGCSKSGNFKVSGQISGTDNETIKVQTSYHGRWITIDSVKTDSKGSFKYVRQAPESPEIYRLQVGKAEIYVPIDSVDNITVEAQKLENGVILYTLSGSDDALSMNSIDALTIEMRGATEERRAEIKKELSKMLLANPAGNAAYYLLNKQVDGKPIYDVTDASDVKIYGAVANAYSTKRPNDPRTPLIVTTFLQNRRVNLDNIVARDTIEASEVRIIEVELPDENGEKQSLTEVTSHGKVVLLNFTIYEAEDSPEYNKILSNLYEKYKSKGFEIYQVGLDVNPAAWKLSAKNIPWITVYDESGTNSRYVRSYNVGVVPLSFVVDRNGEISARIVDQSLLEAEIKKHI